MIRSIGRFSRREISQSDDDLVRECIKGNEEAWSTLIDKYKNLIFSIPVKYGFRTHDADEVFQEVCLALLTELPRLRKPQALAAWLIQATSHRCFHRKREQGRYVAAEPDETVSSTPAAEDILCEVEREQMLREALLELPPRCLDLVRMLFFQEPSTPYEQVAKNLNVAKGSIGFIRMRCLERLRRLLEKKGF
jgi:RNA polymerase sigma factor (sigma-70 family)